MRFHHICLLSLAACMPGLASTHSPAVAAIPAWFEQLPGGSFAARGTEGKVALRGTRAELAFRAAAGYERLEWSLVGASAGTRVLGANQRQARSDYFVGSDRNSWRMNSAHFGQVRLEGAYPGIDVVWYSSGRLLEYDFVVAPGADPSRIAFRISGARPRLTGDGDLEYDLGQVTVRQGRPVAYQIADGARLPVQAAYRLGRSGRVSIDLGAYDRTRKLVIDPVLSYSGYLGGAGIEVATGIAVDSESAVWIAGTSTSDVDSAWVKEPYDTSRNGAKDVFLARIVQTADRGWKLDHWTYLGGGSDDECAGLSMTKDGVLNLGGRTFSNDFPMAGFSHVKENLGNGDLFVARYNPYWEGRDALEYSSYIGTTEADLPLAVAANANGWISIAGYTTAGELPEGALHTALQPSNRGGADGVIYTFNSRGGENETLVMATFFGGEGTDLVNALAMDEAGLVYAAGVTMSWDLPIEGASYQPGYAGGGDAFLTILDPSQSGFDVLKYGTYFGGYSLDVALGMSRTADGLILLAGYTVSDDFPLSIGAYQTMKNGFVDSWAAMVDPRKSGADFLLYSSFLGGSGADVAYAVAQDAAGRLLVAGYTDSFDYPVKNPPVAQSELASATEAFLTAIEPSTGGPAAISYSALFGGRRTDVATAIAIGTDGSTAVAGYTSSPDLTVTGGAGKQNANGLKTSFFFRLDPEVIP